MISKQQFLDSVLKEIRILKHLHSKASEDDLKFRPTEKQRSTLELLRYLGSAYILQLKGISGTGVENFEKEMEERNAYSMPVHEFPQRMDELAELATKTVQSLNDTQLEEQIDLFHRGRPNPRRYWLLDNILKGLVTYKMQLFMNLKGSGHSELATPNLWRGEDT